MQKKELRQMGTLLATPEMLRLAETNKLKKPKVYETRWDKKKRDTRFDMFLRGRVCGTVVVAALFFPDELAVGVKHPLYELYLDTGTGKFITRILPNGQEEKWSEARMENLGRVYGETEIGRWHWKKEDITSRIWQCPEEAEEVRKALGRTETAAWEAVTGWQRDAREEQIRKKEEKEQKPWDEDMALVPPVLPGFIRWTGHGGAEEHFIFYDYDRNVKTGYCTFCRKQVPVRKPVHNKKTVCTCCGKQVQLKAKGRIKTLARNPYYTECIQKIKGGFVIRTFRNGASWRDRTPENPELGLREQDRCLVFENGRRRHYTMGIYKNKKLRWIPAENDYFWSMTTHALYKKNLVSLKKSALKHSAIDRWEKLPCSAGKYLYAEAGNPAIEKLAKAGLFRLARDMIKEKYHPGLLEEDGTELAKVLKIDKARMRRLREMDGGIPELRWFQFEKLADTVWPDQMIKEFANAGFRGLESFGFLPQPCQPVKIWHYLKKQEKLSGDGIGQVCRTWEDYTGMAKTAKWNLQTEQMSHPKDLKAAHGRVVLALKGKNMEKQAAKLEKKWPGVNGVLQGIKKFGYVSGEYQIVVPDGILDIVKEGTALNHCVHTCDFYFDRIQKHESYLFFLRKSSAPDIPWYTLEVEPSGNIRQKRTTGDNQNRDFAGALPFLKEWQEVFRSRLTKEEKELGILADKARIREYKKLRKDGNRVWHGRLAGQLLADVLEADFMAAAAD